MSKLKILIYATLSVLPWSLRRRLLCAVFGFKIAPSAFVSRFALLLPSRLEMGPNSRIGAFTVCKGLQSLKLEENARIGSGNWITAFPLGTSSAHFELDTRRKPQLIVERHSAITNRHIIDCTDEVRIGAFSTFAGFRSQILTHSIDLNESRQRCRPVCIGTYCFVGTSCVLLGGSVLPDRCVLAAQSLLSSAQELTDYYYGGVPAKPIKPVAANAKYFVRASGYVW